MARLKRSKYFYRAMFRPDSLDVFEGFDAGLVGGRGLGYAQAWHKGNTDASPFAIYNELVCGDLGRCVRLPIPPFALTWHSQRRARLPLFSSLDFNFNRETLPQIIPELCVQHLPYLSAGVLAFDILIANEDRHDENLLVDNVTDPRSMHVFDHDQALLGGSLEVGVDRLVKLKDRLAITGSATTGGNRHVFLDRIKSSEDLYAWVERLSYIPDWFVAESCDDARSAGIERSLAEQAAEFLVYRKKNLRQIIDAHRGEFAIDDWPPQLTIPLS
jgi:hypothetical protein